MRSPAMPTPGRRVCVEEVVERGVLVRVVTERDDVAVDVVEELRRRLRPGGVARERDVACTDDDGIAPGLHPRSGRGRDVDAPWQLSGLATARSRRRDS